MNTSLSFAVMAVQWTLVLVLAWGLHLSVRNRHPRWRLMIWRSVFIFGLALPLVGFVRLPRWTIPVPEIVVVQPQPEMAVPAAGPAPLALASVDRPVSLSGGGAMAASASKPPSLPVPWWHLALAVWLAGFVREAVRLLRLHLQLRGIVHRTQAADEALQKRVRAIGGELRIARHVRVRFSDTVASPFLCGVIRPTIVLPRRLAEKLSSSEVDALLSHELAHQFRHDLAWCLGWRWMKAVFWFHPLVWAIPKAHELACEEEADRVASGRSYEGENYARLLANLALMVLRPPVSESPVALHATSHLARRLIQLGRRRIGVWRMRNSVVGGVLAVGLLVLAAGWQFAHTAEAGEKAASVPMSEVMVSVLDQQGNPIEGATITPHGLRTGNEGRIGTGSYFWRPEKHGPATKATTDRDGRARLKYPVAVVAEERAMTGTISFTIDHPDFAPTRADSFPVDGRGKPVVLERGTQIRVSGYFGKNRTPVAEIVPHLIGHMTLRHVVADWKRDSEGGLTSPRLAPGKYHLNVAGRLPSGEMIYGEGVAFFTGQRDKHDFALELKPGVRVEGRLDANVARPVRNGWVQVSVHDDEADVRDERLKRVLPRTSGNTGYWWCFRPIAADGTFVVESVPPGELKVIAYGEGFLSSNGGVEAHPVPPGVSSPPPQPATRGVPQSFALSEPVTWIEVATEASVELTVVVKAGGRPLPGAKVHVSPNMIQMPTGSRIFGGLWSSSEGPFGWDATLPAPVFAVSTDANGIAVLRDVPAFTSTLGVDHPQFALPVRHRDEPPYHVPPRRDLELNLSPGESRRIEVELQPKGRDFIGDYL